MPITNGYLTADEAKLYVGEVVPAKLPALNDAVTAVSRAIDAWCDRHFYQVTESRVFDAYDDRFVNLGAFNDLVSVTSLKTDDNKDGTFETTISASGYQLLPLNRSGPEARPYNQIMRLDVCWPRPVRGGRFGLIEITGTWGWPAVPAAVKKACEIQLARIAKRVDSPLGVAGFGEFGVVRITQLDPDVRALLAPYRRISGIA